jgi:hypothetical protein
MTEAGTGPSAREGLFARRALVAVGAIYLLVQLVLFSIHRAPGWDESVYFSQVTPGVKAMFFIPARARGVPLLVAPVTLLGGSIAAVRLYLAVVSTIAITAVFWAMVPLLGAAAPIASFLFCFSWLGLLNGSEALPNPWGAILGLGVAAMLARRLEGGRMRHLVWASALLALMAVFRPTEAVVAAMALGVYVLVFARSSWRVLVALGAGLVTGWLPWIVENSIRFGGPISAYRAGRSSAPFAVNSVAQTLVQNAGFTNGTKVVSGVNQVPLAGWIWWGALVLLIFYAIVRGTTGTDRAIARLGLIGTLALAGEYVAFVSPQSPRYLLPAYAYVCLPAAIALVSLLRRGGVSRDIAALVVVLMAPWAIWQGSVANRVEQQEADSAASFRAAGLTMRQLAAGQQCAFVSAHGQPEIQFASGCEGGRFVGSIPSGAQMALLASGVGQGFVVLGRPASHDSSLGSLTPVPVTTPTGPVWFIYSVPTAGG